MADNKLTCFFCDKEIITLDKFKLDCNKEVSPTKEPVEMGKIGNKPICSLCFGNIYGMIMLMDNVVKQSAIKLSNIFTSIKNEDGGNC
jgi:hypothetical protein